MIFDSKILVFTWQNSLVTLVSMIRSLKELPFGLVTALRVFTKVFSVAVVQMR